MKSRFAVRFAFFVLAAVLLVPFTPRTNAQEAASTPAKNQVTAKANQGNSPIDSQKALASEKNSEEDPNLFRHSSAVEAIARILHLDVEVTAKIFEYVNFTIIFLAIVIPVFKILPKAFRRRRETIQKQLTDARSATEEASKRLSAVEERLSKLDHEIDAIRHQVEKDSAADEVRIKASIEEEHKRIVEAAGQEIEAASLAARRELKKVAAELAVERAISRLSLTPEIDRRLVGDFARELGKDGSN